MSRYTGRHRLTVLTMETPGFSLLGTLFVAVGVVGLILGTVL